MQGGRPNAIKKGNILAQDLYDGQTFDYVFSNPPFGTDCSENLPAGRWPRLSTCSSARRSTTIGTIAARPDSGQRDNRCNRLVDRGRELKAYAYRGDLLVRSRQMKYVAQSHCGKASVHQAKVCAIRIDVGGQCQTERKMCWSRHLRER